MQLYNHCNFYVHGSLQSPATDKPVSHNDVSKTNSWRDLDLKQIELNCVTKARSKLSRTDQSLHLVYVTVIALLGLGGQFQQTRLMTPLTAKYS